MIRFCCSLLLLIPLAASAQSLRGTATVVDGDTLQINGVEVRLHALDAPELNQTCLDADGAEWACGQAAKQALVDLVEGKQVRCRRAVYDRLYIGDCRSNGKRLSPHLLAEGWAVIDRSGSRRYVAFEGDARRASKNIWAGSFEKPWVWRKHQDKDAAPVFYPMLDERSIAP
ncbi:MAG: thermonuclease family protein [Pseudomonadota bacterium]